MFLGYIAISCSNESMSLDITGVAVHCRRRNKVSDMCPCPHKPARSKILLQFELSNTAATPRHMMPTASTRLSRPLGEDKRCRSYSRDTQFLYFLNIARSRGCNQGVMLAGIIMRKIPAFVQA
jgi:hypothetical protein